MGSSKSNRGNGDGVQTWLQVLGLVIQLAHLGLAVAAVL